MPDRSPAEVFAATIARLTRDDAALAAIVAEHGPPPFWRRPAAFPSVVLFILEQQVSLASAAATYAKIVTRLGAMTPSGILAASPEELREDGVSRQKDRYLRALAEAIETGALDLAALESADDETVRRTLTALPGIGRWTADVYLLICLGRPDIWPVGDRALQVAASEALALQPVPDQAELLLLGERWQPDRSAAAQILWHGYLARRNRPAPIPLEPRLVEPNPGCSRGSG